uniref:Endonuclease domain-containing 1 protein-like n=1 Tax=Monopterus albus TaxID=43700 RepID=A0A3Q3J1A8_MONAL
MMRCLLPLATLLLLLLLSITPTGAEVVQSISNCDHFFLGQTPPEIPGILENGEIQDQNRYKVICQKYDNKKRFVTLYDTKNRIPVFSAYKYRGDDGRRPDVGWMIEPQLEENNGNMRAERLRNQASDQDYKNTNYDRGHLFPSSHAFDISEKTSTFTLTNAVPQVPSFNQGSWSKMEDCVKCDLKKFCSAESYVVTGAVPGTEKLNNRVNIPSKLWSAFCCYSQKQKKWLASAHWGDNVKKQPGYLERKTLQQLKDEVKIQAFHQNICPFSETVAQFYKNLNEDNNCNCTKNYT